MIEECPMSPRVGEPLRSVGRRLLALGLVLTSLAVAGAEAQSVRYRDKVFPSATITSNVPYGAAPNLYTGQTEVLCLDLYEPTGDTTTDRPVLVFVHGGSFFTGDKANVEAQFFCNDMAERGYVVASVSYRLAPTLEDVDDDDIIAAGHDVKAAVRWLRTVADTYEIDDTRIGLTGSSAGGFAVCEAAYNEDEGNSGNPLPSSEVHAVVELWGGMRELSDLEPTEAPLCVVHGTLDMIVPFAFGQSLYDASVTVGLPSELHPFVGVHADLTPYFVEHEEEVVPFLYRWLRLGELSGVSIRPGFSVPGDVVVDVTGEGGFPVALAYAPMTADIMLPTLGTLCLDPVSLSISPLVFLPVGQRLPSTQFSATLPLGTTGTFYLQGVTGGPLGPRLTNCASFTL